MKMAEKAFYSHRREESNIIMPRKKSLMKFFLLSNVNRIEYTLFWCQCLVRSLLRRFCTRYSIVGGCRLH